VDQTRGPRPWHCSIAAWGAGAWLLQPLDAKPPRSGLAPLIRNLALDRHDGKVWLGNHGLPGARGCAWFYLTGSLRIGLCGGMLQRQEIRTLEMIPGDAAWLCAERTSRCGLLRCTSFIATGICPITFRLISLEIYGASLACPIRIRALVPTTTGFELHGGHDVSYMMIDNPHRLESGMHCLRRLGSETGEWTLAYWPQLRLEREVFSRERVVIMCDRTRAFLLFHSPGPEWAGVVSGMIAPAFR